MVGGEFLKILILLRVKNLEWRVITHLWSLWSLYGRVSRVRRRSFSTCQQTKYESTFIFKRRSYRHSSSLNNSSKKKIANADRILKLSTECDYRPYFLVLAVNKHFCLQQQNVLLVMVFLYLSGCGPRNSFRVLYWHILFLNKQDSTEWTDQLL